MIHLKHVHRPGDHDGEALQLYFDEGQSSGQDLDDSRVAGPSQCDAYHLCSRGDEERDGNQLLREGSRDLQSSERLSELRSRRSVGEDLRHVAGSEEW